MTIYFCQECELECRGQVVDQGIGPYEFWGQKGIDVREAFVSECCEALVVDIDENEVGLPEPDEDAAYETMKQKEVDDELEKRSETKEERQV